MQKLVDGNREKGLVIGQNKALTNEIIIHTAGTRTKVGRLQTVDLVWTDISDWRREEVSMYFCAASLAPAFFVPFRFLCQIREHSIVALHKSELTRDENRRSSYLALE